MDAVICASNCLKSLKQIGLSKRRAMAKMFNKIKVYIW
jgi:hypothetical protein